MSMERGAVCDTSAKIIFVATCAVTVYLHIEKIITFSMYMLQVKIIFRLKFF